MSTCSGLAALDHANSKFSRGYATTGVGVSMCARHEFILKNGVGDLQKGERCVRLLAHYSYFTQDPRFSTGTVTWTTYSHRPSATTAPSSRRLHLTTSHANGGFILLSASNVFCHWSVYTLYFLFLLLSQSFTFMAIKSAANLTTPSTFTRALAILMVKVLSARIRSSAPWGRQPGKWALVQGVTRWMTVGGFGTGSS